MNKWIYAGLAFLVVVAIFLTPFLCFASQKIKCYSNGHLIYKGDVQDVRYTGDGFLFTRIRDKRVIFTDANCVIYNIV